MVSAHVSAHVQEEDTCCERIYKCMYVFPMQLIDGTALLLSSEDSNIFTVFHSSAHSPTSNMLTAMTSQSFFL